MRHREFAGLHSQQWSRAALVWNQLGSPLRPVEADLIPVRGGLASWCAEHPGKAPRGLVLGVTPELYRLPWPDRQLVRAAERTPEMVSHVWPGDAAQVLNADWTDMPLQSAGVDIALCDGGLHLLDHPHGQRRLFTVLADAVAPGGLLILRLFVPPTRRETADDVLAALFAGDIGDMNRLKMRLSMALQDSPEAGVALHTVWRTLRDAAGDWPRLARLVGWDLEHLQAIDTYRDSTARKHYIDEPTTLGLVDEAADGAFEPVGRYEPGYPMGERCPTVVLRRAAR